MTSQGACFTALKAFALILTDADKAGAGDGFSGRNSAKTLVKTFKNIEGPFIGKKI